MLDKGHKVPPFSVPDETGKPRTFDDLAGPKGLVLYFYPKVTVKGHLEQVLGDLSTP